MERLTPPDAHGRGCRVETLAWEPSTKCRQYIKLYIEWMDSQEKCNKEQWLKVRILGSATVHSCGRKEEARNEPRIKH